MSGSLRWRWESLDDSFRLTAPSSDQLTLLRATLAASYDDGQWFSALEMQDARAWGAQPRTPLGSDDVNAVEPVNVLLGRRWRRRPGAAQWRLSAGRMTLDYGSRRLVARNGFRNSTNGFQAVRLERETEQSKSQLLYSYPLQREPSPLEPLSLRDNRFHLDKAGRSERFWAVTHDWTPPNFPKGGGVYLLGRALEDRRGRPVADRDIYTLGARIYHRGERWSYEAEGAYQWGGARPTALPASPRLNHRAWFAHLEASLEVTEGLQLQASYDDASGDKDPTDGRYERFDRHYGARAFELGPTGLFGFTTRENQRSHALHVLWSRGKTVGVRFSLRKLALHSVRDGLTTAARIDPQGRSGSDLGRQWELRGHWQPGGGPWRLDLGGALLEKGRFFAGRNDEALLNPQSVGDARYVYGQLSWQF